MSICLKYHVKNHVACHLMFVHVSIFTVLVPRFSTPHRSMASEPFRVLTSVGVFVKRGLSSLATDTVKIKSKCLA